MYEAYFSLEDAPFVLTPDPRFLLRSKGHHEILASLLFGITSQKGLMALIGDVGTGKTTLCRALLRELPDDVQSALVLNPHLSDAELIGTILEDLGVERRGATTRGELMTTLSQYLLTTGSEGKTVVVILDEAQQLGVDSLEQIRLLSNLETATRKLLQILLVGQPELEEKLKLRQLRQLDQRIAIRCYLGPLPRKETFRYIEHRLRIAGLPGALPFTRAAMTRIHRYSRGIPRVINLVCDRALMAAFNTRVREVTPALVTTAIANLEGGRIGRRRHPKSWMPRRGLSPTTIAAGALGLLVLAGGITAHWRGWSPPSLRSITANRASERAVPAAAATAPSIAPAVAVPPQSSAIAPVVVAAASSPTSVPAPVAWDSVRALLARALRLWGVDDDLSAPALAAWPAGPDGALDIEAVAARYQLAATFLRDTSLPELRGIGLPALVEVLEPPTWRPYLLRRVEGDTVLLVSPAGAEVRLRTDNLESAWTRSAWIIWRNVDLLPSDPAQAMSPTVLATLGLRLHKLGYLTAPLPGAYEGRLQQAVQRFQRDTQLSEDGIVGPRTTMALARVTGGRFNPTLTDSRAR
ncbi:MAG TPA: AAA family ATPase [Methylomirabilota bacterium]|nr:AAA family ATPase [Methylomirabilota bacterium]